MKKTMIRIVGAACIVAALLLMFFTAWVKVGDVSRKNMRSFRNGITDDVKLIRDTLVEELEYSADGKLKDDLRDNDLPGTKAGIKRRTKETVALLEELIDEKISLKEITDVTLKAPKYIKDTENLLETSQCAEIVFETSAYVYYDEAEEMIDMAVENLFLFYLLAAFFILLLLLGCAAAVTHGLGKVKCLQYIFLGVVAVMVLGFCIGVPLLSNLVENELALPQELENMTLKLTLMPFVTLILSAVPVVLDLVFDRQKTVRTEAQHG